MRLSEGVEWTVHACVLLGILPEGKALSGAAIAEFLGVPAAYLAKHLQSLSRAGLAQTSRGATGGYRLARSVDAISLHDVTKAVEGPDPAFRCQEVRQRGPGGLSRKACKYPCGIAASFHAAERAWRAELEKVTIADMLKGARAAGGSADSRRRERIVDWLAENAR